MTDTTQQPTNVHVPANAQDKALATAGRAVAALEQPQNTAIIRPGFDSLQGFETLQRMATMFAASSIVPDTFKGKTGDCAIVCEMAARGGLSPLFVFQNLYIVKGKPRWSGKACIAIVNRSGLFDPLEFRWVGEKGKDTWGCYAVTRRRGTPRELVGTTVTMAMVKAEGWGAKWQSMPEQMFQYRAASMWLDVHYPEGLSGLPVEDGSEGEEPVRVREVAPAQPTPVEVPKCFCNAKHDGPCPSPLATEDRTLDPGVDPVSMQTPQGATPFDKPGDQPVETKPAPKRGTAAVRQAMQEKQQAAEDALKAKVAQMKQAGPPAAAPEGTPPAKPVGGEQKPQVSPVAGKPAPGTVCRGCEGKGTPDGCPHCGLVATPPPDAGERKAHDSSAPKTVERKDPTHGELVAWFRADESRNVAAAMQHFGIGRVRASTAWNEASE